MINVASLGLCQELHKLSGWEDHSYTYRRMSDMHEGVEPSPWTLNGYRVIMNNYPFEEVPAYEAGDLLRKLPKQIASIYDLVLSPCSAGWLATYCEPDGETLHHIVADTPEDALCKLAIELFKQGVLKST